MASIIEANSINYRSNKCSIINNISLAINRSQSIAITGISGSGKTTLGQIISGIKQATSGTCIYNGKKRIMVNQQDNFITVTGRKSAYYGQRYENTWMGTSPFIPDYLKAVANKHGVKISSEELNKIINLLDLDHLKERRILQLSNGERKRTQLASALIQKPDLLVLDQPFVGLDVASRKHLAQVLETLPQIDITLVIICDPNEIIPCIYNVIELENGKVKQKQKPNNYRPQFSFESLITQLDKSLLKGYHSVDNTFDMAIEMYNVNVTLSGNKILKDINWQVKRGEQWALLGHNGAGKTTLLSLITADNPQGYTNDLKLFDKQRGSGESVWDIKKRIGYLSPELHLYFLRGEGIYNSIPGLSDTQHDSYCGITCLEVILSGIKDEIGFISHCSDLERKTAQAWLHFMGFEHLENRSFTHTSLGEQRALLLARALVKSPDLIILDEPCQGMDRYQTKHFTHLLDLICKELDTTLVYVTHYNDELPTCIKRTIELKEGARIK